MNRKRKIFIFALLLLGQIVMQRYVRQLQMNLDLLYLVLVYVSVTSGFFKSLAAASVIGLATDYLSGNVLGVFGFSRTIAAYLLNELSIRIDLKNNVFVFLLIAISMAISNGIANLFFHFILGYPLKLSLVLYQPLITAAVGVAIVGVAKIRLYLDVY